MALILCCLLANRLLSSVWLCSGLDTWWYAVQWALLVHWLSVEPRQPIHLCYHPGPAGISASSQHSHGDCPCLATGGCRWCALVWAANSTLLSAVQLAGPLQHHCLDVCWSPYVQQSGSCTEAGHVSALLAGTEAAHTLQHLSWGPCNSVAAVAELSQPISSKFVSRYPDMYVAAVDHMLYVLEPGQGMSNMAVAWTNGGKVVWSPAGDRLLLNSIDSVSLVTSGCKYVVILDEKPAYNQREAVFSSDGKHLAVACACCEVPLRLYNAKNGEVVFSLGHLVKDQLNTCWDLSFSDKSDQLILLGWDDISIICFGWGSCAARTSSTERCDGVAAVSGWTPD